ncbi:MAG: hypothetical protein ACLFS5_01900 [Spirochaetaceae bacterium]
MPRKRMLDPQLWESEQVQGLTPTQFKLYIYLISTADDEGRFKVNWKMLASKAFPLDETMRSEEVRNDVMELYRVELIQLYETKTDGICGVHPNWKRYQSIQKPQPSHIPTPQEGTPLQYQYCNDAVALQPNRIEGNRIEEKGTRAPEEQALVLTDDDESSPETADEIGTDELYHEVKNLFLKHQPGHTFKNWGKEGAAIKQLITDAKARSPDNPRTFVLGMVRTFQRLRERESFFAKQPFIPSALNASGIYERVLDHARQQWEAEQRIREPVTVDQEVPW